MVGWLGQDWQSQAVTWLVTKPISILVLVLMAVALRWFLHRVINRLVHRAAEGPADPDAAPPPGAASSRRALRSGRRVQRAETMGSLLKSIASIVIFTVFGITAIAELGYPVGPLIASAGVVGVALGFGAQSLVKDFLSGIFMIFEDQYGVGDVVDLGEAGGTVEAVGLRVTRLRDVEGTVWYVRNGEIIRVGNQSQNWARTVLDIPVALDQDLHRVQQVLKDVAHDLWVDEDYKHLVIEEPEVWGVAGPDPELDHRAGHAEDRPARAVGGRPRDAPADQAPLRPRGHRVRAPDRDRLGPARLSRPAPPSDRQASAGVQRDRASRSAPGTPGSSSWRPRRRRRSPPRSMPSAPTPTTVRWMPVMPVAGLEGHVGGGVDRLRRACRRRRGRARAPSSSRPSGPPRSAPRGWSCRWPASAREGHETS